MAELNPPKTKAEFEKIAAEIKKKLADNAAMDAKYKKMLEDVKTLASKQVD